MEKPDFTLIRYNPPTESKTLSITDGVSRLPRSVLRTGTKIIYIAVIKPAFPESPEAKEALNIIPNCCKFAATANATPHSMPAIRLFLKGTGEPFDRFFSVFLDTKTRGIKMIPPNM